MTDFNENDEQQNTSLSRQDQYALKMAQRKLEAKEQAKSRAKATKENYLARPDVQEKLRLQKAKMADRRKQYASTKKDKSKNQRKSEKIALAEAQKATRLEQQEVRDRELAETIRPGSSLAQSDNEIGKQLPTKKFPFTVINGGRIT